MHTPGDILRHRPAGCRHEAAALARNTAGAVGVFCDACARWVTKERAQTSGQWLPADHPRLAGVRRDDLPIKPHAIYRVCEHCSRFEACEVHHTAPRQFFGDACERWPVLYLCRACHEEWHAVLTPGLCTTYDPATHARQLFDYLGTDRARELYRALAAEGQSRKAA